jgi:hypothetical protein
LAQVIDIYDFLVIEHVLLEFTKLPLLVYFGVQLFFNEFFLLQNFVDLVICAKERVFGAEHASFFLLWP